MTPHQHPPGAWLLALCARYCPNLFETVVLPAVADLQYEDRTATSLPGRLLVRLRAYTSLVVAATSYQTVRRGESAALVLLSGLRWTLAIPAALAMSLAMQYIGTFYAFRGLRFVVGDHESLVWMAKTATTPLMAAAFVAALVVMAPARKRAVSLTALALVAGWAAMLVAASFNGPDSNPWLFWMGSAGFAGAAVSVSLSWRWSGATA